MHAFIVYMPCMFILAYINFFDVKCFLGVV